MGQRWCPDATQELHRLISTGDIDPLNSDPNYLGDIVSGLFFPQYQGPPPNGRTSAIRRFRKIFRRIQTDRELRGQRRVGEAEEGKTPFYFLPCSFVHLPLFHALAA